MFVCLFVVVVVVVVGCGGWCILFLTATLACSFPAQYQAAVLNDAECVSAGDDEVNALWGLHLAQEMQAEGDVGRICCCLKLQCRR